MLLPVSVVGNVNANKPIEKNMFDNHCQLIYSYFNC